MKNDIIAMITEKQIEPVNDTRDWVRKFDALALRAGTMHSASSIRMETRLS